MKALKKIKSNGFTLVEVIITIIIAAIVGTILFSVLGSSMMKSSEPIFRLQTSLALQQVVENFVTAYEKDFAGDLPALRDAIAGGVLVPAGNAGAALDNAYGKYTIVENHFIKFVSNLEVAALPTDPLNLLKVTIKNSSNETLTYIFAG